MNVKETSRGFRVLEHPEYLEPHNPERIVQESSAVGGYADSFDRPGSSFLWVGACHHLNREQVAELRDHLTRWLAGGRLMEAV